METQSTDFFTFLMEANSSMRNEWFDFLSSNSKPGGVVFAGDSLIQEFCIHEMLSLPHGIQIHNRGIGGDTTDGLLKRVQNTILALKPAIVFILIGTNDLNTPDYNEKTSIDNIRKLITISKKALPEINLNLISVLPINPNVDALTTDSRTVEKIHSFNNLLQSLATQFGCTYIDLHPALCNKNGLLRTDFTRDGLHLKPLGYVALLEKLKPYIQF